MFSGASTAAKAAKYLVTRQFCVILCCLWKLTDALSALLVDAKYPLDEILNYKCLMFLVKHCLMFLFRYRTSLFVASSLSTRCYSKWIIGPTVTPLMSRQPWDNKGLNVNAVLTVSFHARRLQYRHAATNPHTFMYLILTLCFLKDSEGKYYKRGSRTSRRY